MPVSTHKKLVRSIAGWCALPKGKHTMCAPGVLPTRASSSLRKHALNSAYSGVPTFAKSPTNFAGSLSARSASGSDILGFMLIKLCTLRNCHRSRVKTVTSSSAPLSEVSTP